MPGIGGHPRHVQSGRGLGSSTRIGSDVLVQPLMQRRGGEQEAATLSFASAVCSHGATGAVPPADQALVTEQLDPGMVLGIPARSALESLAATDLEAFGPEPLHHMSQPGALGVAVDGMAVPLQLGGGGERTRATSMPELTGPREQKPQTSACEATLNLYGRWVVVSAERAGARDPRVPGAALDQPRTGWPPCGRTGRSDQGRARLRPAGLDTMPPPQRAGWGRRHR